MAGIKSKQQNTLLRQATGQTRTHHHNFTNTPAYAYHHQQNRGRILHLSYIHYSLKTCLYLKQDF